MVGPVVRCHLWSASTRSLLMIVSLALSAALLATLLVQSVWAEDVGVVSHVKVVSHRVADVASMDAVVKSYIKDGMSTDEKVVAIWEAVVAHQHQDQPPKEYLQQSVEVSDPIKMFNVYGYGICSSHSCEVEALARHIGLEARGWAIRGHSVAEVFFDGAWHMVDPSLINYFRKPDGKIASVDEIIAAVKKWHAENPGMNDAGKLTRFMRDRGWQRGPKLLAEGSFYDENGWIANGMQGWYSTMLQYDGSRAFIYEYGYSQGYEVNLQLRPGECITRNWSNRGLHVNMEEGGEPGCLTKKVLEGPKYGDIAPGRIGNGTHVYDVPLATGAVRTGALVWENLAAKSQDGRAPALHVNDPGKDGVLVIRMPSSYAYLTGQLSFRAAVVAGGEIAVSFSDNNGLDWKDLVKVTASAEKKVDLGPFVLRRYDYRLRFVMKGEGTGLDSLRIAHDIQHSQRALPALGQGENTITFTAGPQEGTVTIEGNMRPEDAAGKQLTYLDFHPELQDIQEEQMRPSYGTPGVATFAMATPGDMTRLRLSAHYRARDAGDAYEVELSFDEGKTFAKACRLGGPVAATTKYFVFSDVPAGTRKALVRFTGTQRNTTVMMDMRVSADYVEPFGGFRPVKVTYVWEENGEEKRDVHVARRPEETYTITCGDAPVMRSLIVQLYP